MDDKSMKGEARNGHKMADGRFCFVERLDRSAFGSRDVLGEQMRRLGSVLSERRVARIEPTGSTGAP